MRPTLVESPSGLVHLAKALNSGRIMTECGREANLDTWTRIRALDEKIWGKGPNAISKMIELPKCDRCFS